VAISDVGGWTSYTMAHGIASPAADVRDCHCNQAAVPLYRATLCISAVLAFGRRPSVRHIRVLYPNGQSYHQTFLSVSPINLVFEPMHLYPTQGTGRASAGALNRGWWGKIHTIFGQYLAISWKMYEIGSRSIRVGSAIWSDLKRRDEIEGQN